MLACAGAGGVTDEGAVGDGGVAAVDDERNVVGGLEGGLVKGWEGAAGVGGLKLRDGIVAAGGFGEIEAAQLVIEDAGVVDGERGLASGQRARHGESGLLLCAVEGDRSGLRFARGGDGDGLEGDFDGVKGDGACRLPERDVDGFNARECCGFQIGRKGKRVVRGNDCGGKALGVKRRRWKQTCECGCSGQGRVQRKVTAEIHAILMRVSGICRVLPDAAL